VQVGPNEWKIPCNERCPVVKKYEASWSISALKVCKRNMVQGTIKASEPREARGVVDYTIWDFIDVSEYIYPVLHGEIGLANAVLENFYDFLDDQVEKLSDKEIQQQNATIVADVAFEKSEQQLKDWREVEGANLATHHQEKVMVNNELRRKTITIERRSELNAEKSLLEKRIDELVNERKTLEANVSALRKTFAEEEEKLKNLRKDKGKDERPIRSHVINLLEDEYEISSAAHHGSDLIGVYCRRLLADGMKIFGDIKEFLMKYDHHYEDHCLDATIGIVCELHVYLCSVLDNLSSVLWKKYGELIAEDIDAATSALKNLDYLWTTANLGKTPKFHSLLEHAL
jgi:hypothetical protein